MKIDVISINGSHIASSGTYRGVIGYGISKRKAINQFRKVLEWAKTNNLI